VRWGLDTTLVISGFLWCGLPEQLVQAGIDRRVTLATGPKLLDELADVLSRAKFANRLRAHGFTPTAVLSRCTFITNHVDPIVMHGVVRDPDDDHVIACAVAAKIDYMVSVDRHMLDLCEPRYRHSLRGPGVEYSRAEREATAQESTRTRTQSLNRCRYRRRPASVGINRSAYDATATSSPALA
jgi:putative PIN family toxin of toxin-antitoxin system